MNNTASDSVTPNAPTVANDSCNVNPNDTVNRQSDVFGPDTNTDPPSPFPPNYHLLFPSTTMPPTIITNNFDFVVDTDGTFACYFNVIAEPMTPGNEGGKVGVGDRIILMRNYDVVWTIVKVLTWDETTVVFRMESPDMFNVVLSTKKEWVYVLILPLNHLLLTGR